MRLLFCILTFLGTLFCMSDWFMIAESSVTWRVIATLFCIIAFMLAIGGDIQEQKRRS